MLIQLEPNLVLVHAAAHHRTTHHHRISNISIIIVKTVKLLHGRVDRAALDRLAKLLLLLLELPHAERLEPLPVVHVLVRGVVSAIGRRSRRHQTRVVVYGGQLVEVITHHDLVKVAARAQMLMQRGRIRDKMLKLVVVVHDELRLGGRVRSIELLLMRVMLTRAVVAAVEELERAARTPRRFVVPTVDDVKRRVLLLVLEHHFLVDLLVEFALLGRFAARGASLRHELYEHDAEYDYDNAEQDGKENNEMETIHREELGQTEFANQVRDVRVDAAVLVLVEDRGKNNTRGVGLVHDRLRRVVLVLAAA